MPILHDGAPESHPDCSTSTPGSLEGTVREAAADGSSGFLAFLSNEIICIVFPFLYALFYSDKTKHFIFLFEKQEETEKEREEMNDSTVGPLPTNAHDSQGPDRPKLGEGRSTQVPHMDDSSSAPEDIASATRVSL